MMKKAVVQFGLLLLVSTACLAQTPLPASDPQAVSYASQSMAAMVSGTSVSDIALTGTATWTLGPDTETGTGTLEGKGLSESRMVLTLSDGNRTEVRNGTSGSNLGNWFGPDGSLHEMANQNCWTDTVWFFPALSNSLSNLAGANVVLTYIGQETRGSSEVQHIHSYVYAAGQSTTQIAYFQNISAMDFYLDSTTLLPLAVTFNAYPDTDTNTTLAVEIDFSNYMAVNGVQVPFHIQKYFQGNRLADFTVSTATVNSGLPDSLFAIQ
jgi:hypothetical protein